jgi:hypothetical protein
MISRIGPGVISWSCSQLFNGADDAHGRLTIFQISIHSDAGCRIQTECETGRSRVLLAACRRRRSGRLCVIALGERDGRSAGAGGWARRAAMTRGVGVASVAWRSRPERHSGAPCDRFGMADGMRTRRNRRGLCIDKLIDLVV